MKEPLFSTLENSRSYTIAVADAMPEQFYDFKPKGGGWNFLELIHHIGYGLYWWNENYIKGKEVPWDPPATKTNKKEVIKYLEAAYSAVKDTLEKQKLTDVAVKGFHATLDHTTHHRGQAVVYLRCHGITPPEYTY